MTLIQNAENFLNGLKRLYDTDEAIVFPNIDETFVVMIRSEQEHECDDEMIFEVLIVYDVNKHSEQFLQLLEREVIENDDDEFFLGRVCISKTSTKDSEDVTRDMQRINGFYAMRICPCNRYFIRDVYPVCIYCQMIASEEQMQCSTCTICHEETPKIAMAPRPCCKQSMHMHCLDRWLNSEASGENPTCPICRAPVEKISLMNI